MVNKRLYTVLDGLKQIFEENTIDPPNLYGWFKTKNIFKRDEVYTIKTAENPTMQINVFCDMLKSKPDEIFVELQEMAQKYLWVNVSEYLETKLVDLNFENLLLKTKNIGNADKRENVIPGNKVKLSSSIENIRNKLKLYLQDEVEVIFKYWDKLGASRCDRWEDFYNSNIIITDELGQVLENINNFSDLFKEQRFKRIVVSAPAGYGKSTFVHEMVRQWVKDYEWAQQFSLVFLFRLGEIRPNQSCNKECLLTLKGLLERCLTNRHDELDCFDEELYSKSLFVFDGFDELHREFLSDEVYELIVGQSKLKPYVVVTTRPDSCFEELKGRCNIYIELKGFTENGTLKQLNKFDNFDTLPTELPYDIARIPLFLTLFGILKQKNTSVSNIGSLIDKTVKHLIMRYRQNEPEFSNVKEMELYNILGQTFIYQTNFIYQTLKRRQRLEIVAHRDGYGASFIEMPNFDASQHHCLLAAAKSAHLILPSSWEKEIYFPHKMFADYFAAFYLYTKEDISISYVYYPIYESMVHFKNGGLLSATSWISYFLSYFSKNYKNTLWKHIVLEESTPHAKVPLLDRFDDLPCLQPQGVVVLDFSKLSNHLKYSAMERLKFLDRACLDNLKLESTHFFANLSAVRHLYLHSCEINMSGKDFLKAYNVVELEFDFCTFQNCTTINANNLFKSCRYEGSPRLESLSIRHPEGRMTPFLAETIEMCKSLKCLEVEVKTRRSLNCFQYLENEKPSDAKTENNLIYLFENREDAIASMEISVVKFDGTIIESSSYDSVTAKTIVELCQRLEPIEKYSNYTLRLNCRFV